MSVGIIAEFNPFHNGHQKLITEVKKKYPDATIIVLLSGNFQQRGIPSCLDKWTKTEIALNHRADLVVELPFYYGTQSADTFATGAIKLLKALQIDVLAFGSESNDLEGLKTFVEAEEDENFDTLVQVFLRMGYNYPTSLSKALLEITGKNYQLPNDLLAISYLKAMKKEQANFDIFMVKRENNYHEEEKIVESASSIRNAILNKKDYQEVVPKDVFEKLENGIVTQEDYFPYLTYKILATKDLTIYLGVDPYLAKKLKEKILLAKNYQELLELLHTKNHTYNYISRTLLHILVGLTKEEVNNNKFQPYLRILGFTKKGQQHLNSIKKSCTLPMISKFKREDQELLKLEKKATTIYALALPMKERNVLIQNESSKAPIRKE